MKRYSWYTIVHPDWHPGEPSLYLLVGPAIEESRERTNDIYYKPNRKGGYNRKDSHLLNVEGKKILGKRWPRYKRLYNPRLPLFDGMPKRYWLKLELTKIYYSIISFQNYCRINSFQNYCRLING